MNKWIYLGGVYGLMLPGSMWLGWALVDAKIEEAIPFALAMMLIGWGFLLAFVYRMWAAINDGQTKPSPLAAVGLLLVPLFNIYWVFRVYPGFVDQYNQYVRRHQLNAPQLGRGVFLAMAIFAALGAVPFIGAILSAPNLVLIGIVISRACDAVNRLEPATHPVPLAGLSASA